MELQRLLNAQLLELVRVSLWNKMPEQELFHSCDWHSLFQAANVQAVVGLVADAISKFPESFSPPKDVRMLFIAYVQQIQQMNVLHRAVIKKVNALLRENGVDVVFMKGLTAGVQIQ